MIATPHSTWGAEFIFRQAIERTAKIKLETDGEITSVFNKYVNAKSSEFCRINNAVADMRKTNRRQDTGRVFGSIEYSDRRFAFLVEPSLRPNRQPLFL